jgi:hypothetical protein
VIGGNYLKKKRTRMRMRMRMRMKINVGTESEIEIPTTKTGSTNLTILEEEDEHTTQQIMCSTLMKVDAPYCQMLGTIVAFELYVSMVKITNLTNYIPVTTILTLFSTVRYSTYCTVLCRTSKDRDLRLPAIQTHTTTR